jgi:hypothetical protein
LGALLGNVQYKGMISHKGTLYPGEQEPLVSSELWEEVNRKLGRKGTGTEPGLAIQHLAQGGGLVLDARASMRSRRRSSGCSK